MARFQKVIPGLLRVGLGGVFLFAGFLKAADPAAFALDIDRYQLLPWIGVAFEAIYLPWVEIVAGGALFFRKTRAASLWLLLAMMLVFLIALVSAWMRGLDVRCGCFGANADAQPIAVAILRDAGIVAAIACLLRAEHKARQAETQ